MLWTGVFFLVVGGPTALTLSSPLYEFEGGAEWWRTAALYQVYPRSYKDSNNDGIGDLRGIIEKLPYLKMSGFTAVWLSPIYPSPMVDFGYDIADFTGIHPDYGTMDDFDNMTATAHALGLKIVMDFVPNHSSDQHGWFKNSANRQPGFEDYYVWRDPKGIDADGNPIPPNNWASVFHGPAWTYHETRKQFYLHQFAAAQPDLNYRNPKVVQAMKDVIMFWLKKGVDGFRIDAIPFLFETVELQDEPVSNPGGDPLDYGYLQHIYSFGQDETYDMVQQWRELVDEQSALDGIDRCLMVEAYDTIQGTMRYYGTTERPGAHFPFNFQFISINKDLDAQDVKRRIDEWLNNIPPGAQSNWVIGNHDNNRVASRVGADVIDSLAAVVTLLPGISVTYYGEEIGMLDNDAITYEDGVDPQGCNYPPEEFPFHTRDFERTPFQWDDSVNAGFNTGAKPWLPVHENFKQLNLAAQKSQPSSHYTIFTELLKAREMPAVASGRIITAVIGDNTVGFVRFINSSELVVVLVNLDFLPTSIDLDSSFLLGNRELSVYTTSADSGLKKGDSVISVNVPLNGRSMVVLTPPVRTQN